MVKSAYKSIKGFKNKKSKLIKRNSLTTSSYVIEFWVRLRVLSMALYLNFRVLFSQDEPHNVI